MLSCGSLPAHASCMFSPASITLSGTQAQTSTLTLGTSNVSRPAGSVYALAPADVNRLAMRLPFCPLPDWRSLDYAARPARASRCWGAILLLAVTGALSGLWLVQLFDHDGTRHLQCRHNGYRFRDHQRDNAGDPVRHRSVKVRADPRHGTLFVQTSAQRKRPLRERSRRTRRSRTEKRTAGTTSPISEKNTPMTSAKIAFGLKPRL